MLGLAPLAIAKLFADQIVPSAGIGGNLLLIDRLMAFGMPRAAAVAALLVSMIGYYTACAVLALTMAACAAATVAAKRACFRQRRDRCVCRWRRVRCVELRNDRRMAR